MKINNRRLDSLVTRPKAKPVFESEPVNLPPPNDAGYALGPRKSGFKMQYDAVDSYRRQNFASDLGNRKFDSRYTREMRKLKGTP